MNLLQKLFSHLLVIVVLSTQILSPALAEEDIAVHSLDELPSSQIESTKEETISQTEEKTIRYETSASNEDIMSLIAAKQSFEAEQKKSMLEVPSIASLLEQNSALWGVTASASADSFLAPKLAIKSPTIKTFFPASDFSFSQSGNVFAHSKERNFRVPKEAKLGESTHGKFAKNPTQVKLAPETIITAADGTLIDPAKIGLYEVDTAVMSKANSYHEKKAKKKGNKTKGFAKSDANTFDFGIPGTHLIFSKPVEISLYTPNFTDGIMVDIATLHAGDSSFNTSGLSTTETTECNSDGTATIPGSTATVNDGKVTFYTCGASSFTINPTGGTAGSNDLRMIIGDCGQFQLYYNGTNNMYTGNPPATGCNTTLDTWIALRIGGTTYWSESNNWTSRTTNGAQNGNTYTATTTLTRAVGGRTYTLILNWTYEAPRKYFTIDWSMNIPTGNTNNVRFYIGNDSMVGGNDANDTGYSGSAPTPTLGVYDGVLDQLSAIQHISGPLWTAGEAGPYNTIRTRISGGTDFANTIQTTSGDLGFGVDWNFGTTPGTYTGTINWRMQPYVSANVPDLIPGIGQPVGPLTTNHLSELPITVSNIGNLASSGTHTVVLTIPANINGPSLSFNDNGWSCGAQVGTDVTCTKNTSIDPFVVDTVNIPVTPTTAASGSSVTFNVAISNPSDSDTSNNTAFATNAVVGGDPTYYPGGVSGDNLWLRADIGTNCIATGCTITSWSNNGTLGAAANAVTGLGTVTYTPNTQINFNPTLYFNNASLNTNNNLGLPTRANSIFVVSRIGTGGNFYMGTQTVTNNTRSWRTSPTTDQWMRYNSTIFYNGANGRSADTPAITSTIRQTAGASAGYTNGRSMLTSATTTTFTVNNFGIGRVGNTNSTLANVAEVIIYNSAITAANQNRVESYLALKYGITLDQTTATNYVYSNGMVAWNATSAGSYNKNIAGIIRDDTSNLEQNRSQSVTNASDIIVEKSGITADKRALIWANNGDTTGTFGTTDVSPAYQRIGREWQFQEKNGDVGNVKISYPASSLPSGASSPIYMLVDDDGVFAAGATAYTGTLNGANWEFTANLSDMQYVTFAQDGDTTPPTITSINIASGTLIPHGNFSLTYNYTDTGAGIDTATATGQIYAWNAGSSSYDATPLAGYMSLSSSSNASATMNISNLPFGRYRFDMSISDALGNTTVQSYTYFVDGIEWTVSADTFNIGDMLPATNSFGTGELLITIRTVGAGFTLTNIATSTLVTPMPDTINYWNGTIGWGYDQWNGSAYSGNITSHSPTVTLANVAKNINQNGQKNTFTYRIKYGANVLASQETGDYTGTVGFGLNLTY